LNQLDHWLLPDGVEDLLPTTAAKLELARQNLLSLFSRWGYDYVMPPKLEFIDSLLTGTGKDLDLQTVKVIDQISGRLMGLPADITPQVARMDAHSIGGEGVSRLCYAGSVVRARPKGFVGSRTPIKVGAELFGDAEPESDLEIVSLMVGSLAALGLLDVQLELGDVSLFRTLIEKAQLDEDTRDEIFALIQKKANHALAQATQRNIDDPGLANTINRLPLLCGDLSVLDEASELFVGHSDLLDGVERLRQLSRGLLNRYPNLRISIDLSELRGFNYHTGTVFSAYDAGSGQLVARGGRYDNVGELFGRSRPATGFDIEISTLVDLLPEPDTGAWVVVNRSQGADQSQQTLALWTKIESLRAEGYRVIEGEPPVGIEGYQLVLDANEWVLKAL